MEGYCRFQSEGICSRMTWKSRCWPARERLSRRLNKLSESRRIDLVELVVEFDCDLKSPRSLYRLH